MRRGSSAMLVVALVVSASSAAVVSASPGSVAADDVSLAVGLQMSRSPDRTTSLNFQVFVEVVSGSGVEQPFTLTIALPAGLRWGADAPDPSEGCTGDQVAVCKQVLFRNAAGTVAGGGFWDVVAERVGFYEITATVEPEQPDPDLSNNRQTFRFEVTRSSSGGGGGWGGTSVTASAVRVTPKSPKAGAVVAASVRVTAGGTRVRPIRLTCAGTIGGAKLTGIPRAGPGAATCLYRTPRTAKGKTLRGAVAFTARGTRITRRFAAKLG